MQISNLRLKNFKSFDKLDIEIKNLTLLTGINSAGKSSLIQSLLLLAQSELNRSMTISRLMTDTFLSKFFKDDFYDWQKLINNSFGDGSSENVEELKKRLHLKINNSLLDQEPKLNLRKPFVDVVSAKSLLNVSAKEDLVEIEVCSEDKKIFVCFEVSADQNEDSIPCQLESTSGIDLNLLSSNSFQYLSAERVSARTWYDYSLDTIKNNGIGIHGDYAPHYLAYFKSKEIELKALKHPATKTLQIQENTQAWLTDISEGIDINVELRDDLKQVLLTYSYGGHTFNPKNVGFGITYVLPVIVAILKAKKGDLLIVENPESHLHPSGQVAIAKLIAIAASAGVQIIVESHSDHILNGIRVATKQGIIKPDQERVYYFEKKLGKCNSNVHKLLIDDSGNVDNWPKGFFDEWDNQLDNLLW